MEPEYIKQTEKGYLWEVSQLIHGMVESQDLEMTLRIRDHLHANVYPRMHQFGFESKEAVRQAIDYWKAEKPDPDKEARAIRAEQWMKERGIDDKEEKPSFTERLFSKGRQLGQSVKERLGIGKEDKDHDKDVKDADQDLDRE